MSGHDIVADTRAVLNAAVDQFNAAAEDAALRYLRRYELSECGADGYPVAWHEGIKDLIREAAGHRCVRCGHPYRKGENGDGEWSACDERCRHRGPARYRPGWCEYGEGMGDPGLVDPWADETVTPADALAGELVNGGIDIDARWRILTVHHLTGEKADCRWWNLAALCQRCHLQIQGRVKMAQVWPHEHSDWFKPYAAGYYAATYLGEELTPREVGARLDELLALERAA